MKTFLQFLLIVSLFSSCNNDDGIVLNLAPVSNLDVRDISNFGNAIDLEVSFRKPSDSLLIEEFRIFIVKSINSTSFDSITALGLSSNFFTSIPVEDLSLQINFPGNTSDTDGSPITEGTPYKVFILSKAKDANLGGKLSNPTEITLERKSAVRTLTGIINGGSGGMDVPATCPLSRWRHPCLSSRRTARVCKDRLFGVERRVRSGKVHPRIVRGRFHLRRR